jgi:uncharacterized protein YkwD
MALPAGTNASLRDDPWPIPAADTAGQDRQVPTILRRLGSTLFAALLLASLTGTAAATEPVFDLAALAQAEADLGTQVNAERRAYGLVNLQLDPTAMAIAGTMAANDLFSHANPDGTSVFDAIKASGIPWLGAGEVIVWNSYAGQAESTAQAVLAWMASPLHRSLLLSTDYNYIGYGAAISPVTGRRYYAGVLIKRTDRTPGWVKAGSVSKRYVDARRTKVTVRWTGGDVRLQVLTAGIRDYEVQRRIAGGTWRSLGYRTGTSVTETLGRGHTYEYRIRARDGAGNRSPWTRMALRI